MSAEYITDVIRHLNDEQSTHLVYDEFEKTSRILSVLTETNRQLHDHPVRAMLRASAVALVFKENNEHIRVRSSGGNLLNVIGNIHHIEYGKFQNATSFLLHFADPDMVHFHPTKNRVEPITAVITPLTQIYDYSYIPQETE